MEAHTMQTALDTLFKIRESLLESMVEELISHKDDDSTSFSLQEIEDRFAIRLANLNTLIATVQDQLGHYGGEASRVVADVLETPRNKLQNKLEEIVEFIHPDDLLHLSVVPDGAGKYLIITVRAE